jgi:hypothetical protein
VFHPLIIRQEELTVYPPYGNNLIGSIKLSMPAGESAPAIDLPKVHVAVAGDKVVSAMGSIDEMKSFVHRSMASPSKPSGDIRAALLMVDNSAEMDLVASVNILRVIGIVGKTMATAPVPQAQEMGGMLSSMRTDSRSCAAIAAKIDNGTANVQFILPKDHLMEVMGAVMQMQQQMMQKQMQQIKQAEQKMESNSGGKKSN